MPLKIFEKLCSSNERSTTKNAGNRLPIIQRFCYGIGHVLNDLCANCWFSYLLIYMTKVISLSDANAGLILLIGQVADALFTPFIGYGCDKTNFKYYGRRKLWHLIGTMCVLVSFPFIFNECVKCDKASTTIIVLYYACFVVIFQFGWAAVQISHLSLIPEIAHKVSQKVELNSIRSGLTFVCGIYVFGIIWLLLGTNPEENVTQSVAPQFMHLSFIVIGTGCVFSIIFHIGTREPRHYERKAREISREICDKKDEKPADEAPVHDEKDQKNGTPNGFSSVHLSAKTDDVDSPDNEKLLVETIPETEEKCKTWREWLKSRFFFKMALVYMCTRLTFNVSQAYFVLYLTETMVFKKEAIAYFPLLVLVSGVFASILVKILTKRIGGKLTFILGSAVALGSFVWLFLVTRDARKSVYAAALLMGGGTSIMLVTSLAMTADLIGTHKGSCAFVYSAMSFTDKLSSGIVIYVIQQLKTNSDKGTFTRYVQSTVTGVSCLIALICVAVFFPSDFKWKRRVLQTDVQTQTILEHEEAEDRNIDHNKSITGIDLAPDNSNHIENDNLAPESIDDKLKRVSWHSSMTSYIAWRLASPYVPSPVASRHINTSADDAEPV